MELFGIAITILAAILTYQAWKNGRWMKQAHQDTQALIKGTQDMIKEMHKDTTETLKEIANMQKEIANMQKEIANMQKEIAHLIVAEGEKTRQAIKA